MEPPAPMERTTVGKAATSDTARAIVAASPSRARRDGEGSGGGEEALMFDEWLTSWLHM